MIVATLVIFSLGFGILIAVSLPSRASTPTINASTVLSLGVALASYAVQRSAFREWRTKNTGEQTSSWVSALGFAALYSAIWILVVLPIYVILLSILSPHGVPKP